MKMALKVSCFALALVFGFVQSSVLPVEKCTLKDKTCMVPAFQKMLPIFMAGMPENNVELLDPMTLSDMKFDLSGLKFSMTKGSMEGLKSAVVEDVVWNTKKKVFTVQYHADIVLKGKYKASGKVLVLPITGDGDFNSTMKNLDVKLSIHYDLVKTDGKDHVKPTKYAFEFDVKDGATYHLTNLFNGNKQLSEAMLKFLNDNWKQVATEFGSPVVDVATKDVFKNIGKFFEKMPLEEIAMV